MSHFGMEVPTWSMALLNHGTSTLLVATRSTPRYTCTCIVSETCRGGIQGDAILFSTQMTCFLGLSSVISSMSKAIHMYPRHLHLNCVKIMLLFCQSGSHCTGLDLVAALITTDIHGD